MSNNPVKYLRQFPNKFWLLNFIQMTEKLAYWIVVLQMPIYIAQKDIPGGLHWDQTIKGIIYFWWALMQHVIPLIAGGYADRYGRRKFLNISFLLIILGYVIIGSTQDFSIFLIGVIILGGGSGIFKPTLQGSIADSLDETNSRIGWGLYVMLLNFAVFFGPPVSIFLKNISWSMVFYGSAALFTLNFLLTWFIKDFKTPNKASRFSGLKVLRKTFKGLASFKIGAFVLLMSGFTIIYMQFYETLPNFIYDWVDTSQIVNDLNLAAHFTMDIDRGTMVAYEWLYNLNAGFVIIGVVFFSWLMKKFELTTSIIIGIIIATAGLFMSGATMLGYMTVAGMLVYTLGEMITNPRFTEYMGKIAPKEDKALYMGYMSISWAIGLAGGGVLGGFIYKHLGEKAGFALDYMQANHPEAEVNIKTAFQKLTEAENLTSKEATNLLWNSYDPYMVWLPFVAIGIVSVIGLVWYGWRTHIKNQ